MKKVFGLLFGFFFVLLFAQQASAACTAGRLLWVAPQASTQASETHASLVTSTNSYSTNVNFNGVLRTVRQLRINNPPNAWEVAWMVWNFQDNTHFYYIALKPNGWELGKADPAYPGAQRFLASGTNVLFPVGQWYDFQIAHNQTTNRMTVTVNGVVITSFVDAERPYKSGKIGFYAEDAEVELDSVTGQFSDAFDYSPRTFVDGSTLPPNWTVNFLGFGSGGIR